MGGGRHKCTPLHGDTVASFTLHIVSWLWSLHGMWRHRCHRHTAYGVTATVVVPHVVSGLGLLHSVGVGVAIVARWVAIVVRWVAIIAQWVAITIFAQCGVRVRVVVQRGC